MTLASDMRISILLARRARYLSTSMWLLIAVIGLAVLASQFSGRQPATVALDVGISVMRLLLPLLIVLLAQELITKEFDRRFYLTSLTYPRPRHQLLLGRFVTILFLIYLTQLLMALALALAVDQLGHGYEQATHVDLGSGYWITLGHMAIDLFVITAVAILLSVVAITPSFVLIGTLGFMLIARSYSNIIALLQRDSYLVENADIYQHSLGLINFIVPDLAALDVRIISLYNAPQYLPEDWAATLLATFAYGLALFAISLFALQRRRFN